MNMTKRKNYKKPMLRYIVLDLESLMTTASPGLTVNGFNPNGWDNTDPTKAPYEPLSETEGTEAQMPASLGLFN